MKPTKEQIDYCSRFGITPDNPLWDDYVAASHNSAQLNTTEISNTVDTNPQGQEKPSTEAYKKLDLISVAEFSRLTSISPSTIRAWTRKGRIPFYRAYKNAHIRLEYSKVIEAIKCL